MWNLVGIFLILIFNQVQALCNCEEELARFKNEFKAEVKAEVKAEIKAELKADLDAMVGKIISNSNQEIIAELQSHGFKLETHEKTLKQTQELITENTENISEQRNDFDEEIQHLTTLSKVY